MLWHYTDATAAVSMIRNKEFWASHVRHMNDTGEMQQFADRIAQALRVQVKLPINSEIVESIERAIDGFESWLEVNYFVVSFSQEPDSLSQWRGYGGTGQGYALGFAKSMLTDINGWRLVECAYVDEVARDFAAEIVNDGLRAVRAGGFEYEIPEGRVWQAIYPRAITEAPSVKDQAFREEREWRLVGGPFPGGSVEVRAGRRGMLPYVKLPWKVDGEGQYDLREIVAGPGAAEDTFHAMEIATHHDALFPDFPRVLGSDVPYRA
ncbi:DUF2971 domain-containing protein [Rathayibacter sp. VKM Ac-2804]|uniref:DUF2971 domain-containing protein n=1 Tax=Rathayibacter sp. VKM Ac-2804 TaxID=2609257 RepID=UPI00132EE1BC|nr:DUF2971 domain-containing protein [Rathayibacter sp. VKM Ac-2804]QHF24216.1 DUF2971 domain-containing protein [Rathayibacter sp. VKM Ac-2804]